jgi:hypothetical protein
MNGWIDEAMLRRAQDAKASGEFNVTIGTLGESVVRALGAYDAGFEAGVLASEAGVGRYDG